jgi:hypothetical protein
MLYSSFTFASAFAFNERRSEREVRGKREREMKSIFSPSHSLTLSLSHSLTIYSFLNSTFSSDPSKSNSTALITSL